MTVVVIESLTDDVPEALRKLIKLIHDDKISTKRAKKRKRKIEQEIERRKRQITACKTNVRSEMEKICKDLLASLSV